MYLKNELARMTGRAYGRIAIPEDEAYLTDAELLMFGEQLDALNAQYAEAASISRVPESRSHGRLDPLRFARAQVRSRVASRVPTLRQWFATML